MGIGCNPKAVVTGNPLEDEKASGMHIVYAMIIPFGGKMESDMLEDIIYAKVFQFGQKSSFNK